MSKRVKLNMKICTHSGSFHADEALAVFMLRLLPKYSLAELIRSRNPTDWEASDVVIDVGGKYDGEKFFDHHQREFKDTFSDNYKTRLSSAGLIYKHFGKEIIAQELKLKLTDDNVELLYQKVYKEFIESLDANDNGVSNYPLEIEQTKKFNDRNIKLPSLVSRLNPSWNTNPTDADFDRQFLKASELMGTSFLGLLEDYGNSWLPAKTLVEAAYNDRFNVHESGEIMVLENYCPWTSHLYAVEKDNNKEGEVKFVLFQDTSLKWRVSTVAVAPGSFEFRVGLPDDLRGLRDEELSQKSGIEGCIFVHAAGFIGGANLKEAVFQLALKGLESRK